MLARLLIVNEALHDATPLFAAAGRLVGVAGGRITAVATPTADSSHWATWADHHVGVVHVTDLDAGTVVSLAEQIDAEVIVLGSGCGAGRAHTHTPALTEAVTLDTTRPVLLLRADGEVRVPEQPTPFRTLVPVDGSTVAEHILPIAASVTIALAGEAGGELHLMQVLHGVFGTAPLHRETMLPPDAQARWYLDQLAERLRTQVPPQITVTSHSEPSHDVAEALLRELGIYPRTDGVPGHTWDMVAMGVLGPTGHEPHDQSSVVNRVVHATTLPLLVQCQRITLAHDWVRTESDRTFPEEVS